MAKKHADGIEFPLMVGGPLYQFYVRASLVKPPLNFWKRRITFVVLLSWLPLLLLSCLGGTAFSSVKIPFIFDIDTHVRFLIALGLFVGAEVIVHQRIQGIVNQFIERNIITSDVRPKFDKIIASALNLRNSYTAEIVLLVLVYTIGHYCWTLYSSLDVSTWYSTIVNGQSNLTMAGYWYVFISIPIFQFILCRWYYRIFIWYRFLWQVSGLPLHLNCLHPDRAGGLGFLSLSVIAFEVGLIAHTVVLAGLIANRIWHAGQILPDFKLEIVSILLFLLFLALTPLTFFIIPLARAKRKGLVDYGMVACDYVNNFRSKWMGEESNKNVTILGTQDIQSLADLSTSFAVANEMRLVPFDRNTIIQIVLLTSFPLLPLLLTMIPFTDMIDRVIQILL